MSDNKENFTLDTVEHLGTTDIASYLSTSCSYCCSCICCLIIIGILYKVFLS